MRQSEVDPKWYNAISGWQAMLFKILTLTNHMTIFELTADLIPMADESTSIFNDDRMKQGQYFEPTMIQFFEHDGKVCETLEIGDDGTVRKTKGGEFGVVPSAPETEKQKQSNGNIFMAFALTLAPQNRLSRRERKCLKTRATCWEEMVGMQSMARQRSKAAKVSTQSSISSYELGF